MYNEALAPFADAMANVGAAIEATFERQQVEWVFGLTGGELDDKPLKFRAKNNPAQEYGEVEDREWTYHYDGVPEWAGEDFDDKYDPGVDYFTLVEFGCDYGSSAPAWLEIDGKTYVQVRQYSHSGETECPCKNKPEGSGEDLVGAGHTEGMQRCPMCEEDAPDDLHTGEHGYIYLGPGCESVYKHVEFSCEECGQTKADTMEAHGAMPNYDAVCCFPEAL